MSVEITNEGAGWHLHSHWLLDADWLEMPEISRQWGKLVGQTFAVCKVMDVRDEDYIREVTKYVVEGSEMAKWPREAINEFVRAVRGRRFFFAFGSLFKDSPEIRRALTADEKEKPVCECGCEDFIFRDEQDEAVAEILRMEKSRPHGRRAKSSPNAAQPSHESPAAEFPNAYAVKQPSFQLGDISGKATR